MNKIKVLVVPSDTQGGVGFFRSIQPHVQLEEQFNEDFEVTINPNFNWDNKEELKTYDIVNFHKGVYTNMQSFRNALEFCKNNNITTIMDIDDFWELDKSHPMYSLYKMYGIDKTIKDNLKLVDYVTTTTELFANKIRKFNKNVVVLPNAINPEDKRFKINRKESDKVRVGLIMSSSHEKDMKLLESFTNKLSKDVLNKITIVLCGFDTSGTLTVINPETKEKTNRHIKPMETVWYRYEKCLTDNYRICSKHYSNFLHTFLKDVEYENINAESYKRCWTKNINEYYQHYNEVDVLLVPLEENEFNSCKSQLKVVESAFANTAIIASNFGPYTINLKHIFNKGGETNEDGNAILIDRKKCHKDWVKYVTKIVNNKELLKTLQKRLHDSICNEFDLRNITQKRCEFYKKVNKRG